VIDSESEDENLEPVPTNPLDLLPPTTLNLEEWKRKYSNSDVSVSIPWFWENFDKNGYSLWFSDYKYNDELEQLFKTSNLVLGFLQRLDKLRKYAFGSILIFGDKKFEISGGWVFRGLEIPQEMLDCDDYSLYNWRRADPDHPSDKKKISEYFAWAGDFDGRVFQDQGKIFK